MNIHKNSSESGFIRTVVILIVVLIILNFAGLNATGIWNDIFLPIFSFVGDLIVSAANFLVSLIKYGLASFNIN